MDISRRLYYFDSHLSQFEAVVIHASRRDDGNYELILDESAFYPTSGGQPHDVGTLNETQVIDVLIRDDDVVHVVENEIPVGTHVHGTIDWGRRLDHMQHHCGQHILSAAFEELFDLDTVGFHMSEHAVTVDIATPALDAADLARAERLANQIVFENRTVTAQFVDAAAIPGFSLRYPPKVDEHIRVVTIDGFNHNACGGTHPQRTGEIGLIKVTRQEKVRNATRLSFVCGARALRDYDSRVQVTQQLASRLSVEWEKLPAVVAAQLADSAEQKRLTQHLQRALAEYRAKERLQAHIDELLTRRVAIARFEDCSDAGEWKMTFKAFQQHVTDTVQGSAVVAVAEFAGRVHIQGQSTGEVDMKHLLAKLLSEVGGRGGGTAQLAQGSAPSSDDRSLLWYEERLRMLVFETSE
ncbi:alanine--tRNA ligase-related protein [Alicyclobacillus fastidiosus]|uniref:Alanine--tRNA ligase-related protein n=1 Tax=Alicyclobacillus fastidiosus TaxID=392011 RepID=A0ABY6ZIQ5_9BACL|nr:alanine--tRNA ligase-related protein [Alicyclobacillus fastidiosus]WAH42767.1 alanine--tRNA ligase-related protein [Alicyclobacillus fastidiosus]GMA64679.1 alanyl-tRNA editing protein [Alicyclobacillus fastidiosus]